MKYNLIATAVLTAGLSFNAFSGILSISDIGSVERKLQVAGDPALAIVDNDNEGDFFADSLDGVGSLFVAGGGICTTTLINERQAVTAAHCFGDPQGDGSTLGLSQGGAVGFGDAVISGNRVFFDDVRRISRVDINPLWLGATGGTNPDGTPDVTGDGDIAIITFDSWIYNRTFYDLLLDNTFEEFFQPHVRVGRGTAGDLGVPGDADNIFDFQRRIGLNQYDFTLNKGGDTVARSSIALYDCDNGDPAFDFFGPTGRTPNELGFGQFEACADGGDSGSGNFIVSADGRLTIAGITSFGTVNQQYGGIGGDTRTAAHANWIRSTLATDVPVPATIGLFGLALAALFGRRLFNK